MKMAPKKVRGRLKEVVVEFEIFRFNTYCVVGPYEDLTNYLKWRHRKSYVLSPKNDADGLYFNSRQRRGGVIWLPRVPRKPCDIGNLVHEVGHAVIEMFGCRDLLVGTKSQEPFCYAIGYGVEMIMTELRK